jgi:hypothetical protein
VIEPIGGAPSDSVTTPPTNGSARVEPRNLIERERVGHRRLYKMKGTSILVERLYAGYPSGNCSVRFRSSMVALYTK